ncbi:MAG: hypothetical protein QOG62_2773 [Thermoleophilaceae bacterium]|jgi:hypothetical protein|nr:hypothetical protein [Thermoleophilaceae bacterium]
MSDNAAVKLATGLDPRKRIYRSRFNEYFLFIASASGAALQVPIVMLIVTAFTGMLDLGTYLAASVLIELFIIFALARPQMKPKERVGWALLWGSATAVFGVCFYYLVLGNIFG